MSDDPSKTQHMTAESIAELAGLSKADDAETPDSFSLREAQESELIRVLGERDRSLKQASVWRSLTLALTEHVGKHQGMGVSFCNPRGGVVYQNETSRLIVPSREAEQESISDWEGSFGTLRDTHGRIIPQEAWPMAQALGGIAAQPKLYLLDGRPIVISAVPVTIMGETWGLATFFLQAMHHISEASDD